LPPMTEARVWVVELDRSERDVGVLGGVLTADELLRAGRIKAEAGQRRAVVARAALRLLLARELGRAPEAIVFAAGPHGKPRLAQAAAPVSFNLSHSAGLALIAMSTSEVGVDVEQVKPRKDLPGVARRVFTAAERAEVEAGGDVAFYRHWVAKEAFVKATGRGISSLKSFEVALDAPGGPRLTHVGGDPDRAARWTLAELEVPGGYAAAVVVASANAKVHPPRAFEP
jgi:4'-phosphopantetheinyl transferase